MESSLESQKYKRGKLQAMAAQQQVSHSPPIRQQNYELVGIDQEVQENAELQKDISNEASGKDIMDVMQQHSDNKASHEASKLESKMDSKFIESKIESKGS